MYDFDCSNIHLKGVVEISNVSVSGVNEAFRAQRNPMKSWDKATPEKDIELALGLAVKGDDHSKALRMINITFDILAPEYLLMQLDTYKVGTVSISTSKMHRLLQDGVSMKDFYAVGGTHSYYFLQKIIRYVNDMIYLCRTEEDVEKRRKYFEELNTIMPMGFRQLRTMQVNVITARHIYHQRNNHKLPGWEIICKFFESLPYPINKLITAKEGETE